MGLSITVTGSVSQYAIESLGRRRVTQFGQLDQMQCVFYGPDSSFNNFPINAKHPEYPLMFVVGSQATAIAGGIVEMQVNYEGKLVTNGASSYVTYPVTTENNLQGSRDFQQTFITLKTPATYSTGSGATGPGGGVSNVATYDYGTQSLTVRYIGSQCSVRYQSYPRPTKLHYSSLGLGRVSWRVLSSTIGARSVAGSGVQLSVAQSAIAQMQVPGIPPLYAANLGFDIQQRGLWYDCTEIYGPTF